MSEVANPISPGLHNIPVDCPLCGHPQYQEGKFVDRGSGEGVEDLHLGDNQWTVCHVECKALFRDAALNRLVELGRIDTTYRTPADELEYDILHEAIRCSMSYGSLDVLIEMVGMKWFRNTSS